MTSPKHAARFVGDPLFSSNMLSVALPEHVDAALREVVSLRNRNAPRMAVAKVRVWALDRAQLKPLRLEAGRPRIDLYPDLEPHRANDGPPRTSASMYVPYSGSGELWLWAPNDVQFDRIVGHVQPFGEDGTLQIAASVPIGFEHLFTAALEDYLRRIERMLSYQRKQVERFNALLPRQVETAFPRVGERKRVAESLRSIRVSRDPDGA